MPLALVHAGQSGVIKSVHGKPEVRQFLEGLGFVAGAEVTVINEIDGNIICSVKEARVAISKEMAMKIMV